MPDNTSPKFPQVTFSGTGLTVAGHEVSGDVLVAWFRYAADRGYVLKMDAAFAHALERTYERDNLPSLLDSVTNLIQIANGAAL